MFLHWRILENQKGERKKVNRKSHDGDGEWWEEGLLPDTEVRAAGVIASNRGHSACVGAYVTWPGLGDVKRTICI